MQRFLSRRLKRGHRFFYVELFEAGFPYSQVLSGGAFCIVLFCFSPMYELLRRSTIVRSVRHSSAGERKLFPEKESERLSISVFHRRNIVKPQG